MPTLRRSDLLTQNIEPAVADYAYIDSFSNCRCLISYKTLHAVHKTEYSNAR